jgi:hypothetical protein
LSSCARPIFAAGLSKGPFVSNPVAPPPPASEGGFPPAANQGFGDAPAQPGYPPPAPPQQGIGDSPVVPEPPKKKSVAGRILLRIGLTVVVLIIGLVVKDTFFGDKAKDAAVGDCIASSKTVTGTDSTEAEAKVVACGSGDAAFTVVGRVNGETDTNSKSCDKYFKEKEEFYVYSSTASGGYLLCLRPKA